MCRQIARFLLGNRYVIFLCVEKFCHQLWFKKIANAYHLDFANFIYLSFFLNKKELIASFQHVFC